MSKNVNVFIGVLLCAVLCGTFVWLSSSGDESSWSPNDIYNEVQGAGSVGGYATTSATFSGPSNEGGVALPMSSSSMRARSSYKYAGAYSGASYAPLASSPLASSPLASSPLTYGAAPGAGMHLTSSAEVKSFGGGGNGGAAMGGAMSNGRSNSGLSNPSLQGGAGVGISPIAYSTARRSGMSSVEGGDLAMMAAETPVMAMSNAASVGMGNGFYGSYSVMDYSSATYSEYTGMFGGGRMGVRGRQNAGPSNNESNWLNWLALNGQKFGSFVDGVWMLDVYALRNAYDAYCDGWNETMGGKMPTWDEWLAWFMGSEDSPFVWSDGENSSSYQFLPVGDILPLLLLALLYILAISLKSLKSERSE